MQGILLSSDVNLKDIEDKNILIQEGYKFFNRVKTILACPSRNWVLVRKITEVIHREALDITKEEYESLGCNSVDEALDYLKDVYPDLDWHSPITVLRWKNSE